MFSDVRASRSSLAVRRASFGLGTSTRNYESRRAAGADRFAAAQPAPRRSIDWSPGAWARGWRWPARRRFRRRFAWPVRRWWRRASMRTTMACGFSWRRWWGR